MIILDYGKNGGQLYVWEVDDVDEIREKDKVSFYGPGLCSKIWMQKMSINYNKLQSEHINPINCNRR